ncbi:alpha-1,6-mannosyltransferase [Purpureocillium takamizusanense]|uniref:Alpha-1,6-mannosyltransferase n=1 Tax=Purpureocillium takamizusanense TaxID=2060973 RepID=A0A9Q8Q8L3_9HYPO|nr:alpha-1,6-mannosyltransferase [Purpureocillium takamizusanense]UNI14446.1 alpha-1,6-mannosyltransferase [Purpureocillium takamizusanense]
MSLSRSPSPVPGGGWSSPGLNLNSGRNSPAAISGGPVQWESAKMRHLGPNGYPSFSTHNQGFFSRHMRRISSSLPRFGPTADSHYADKDKFGRGRWPGQNIPLVGRIISVFGRMGRKMKIRLLIGFVAFLCIYIFYHSPLIYHWRRASWGGGGEKFVIILGANVGGGVMEWKGAREWAIERDSVRNKRNYVNRWGYDLEVVDMKTRKKYAHEWRESWEKVDFMRTAMRKYPNAEWFWWLDLNTIVMEPFYSLQDHIFDDLSKHVYRDINEYNPLNISHPFTDPYLDPDALSPTGDGNVGSINMVLSQDCSGFNLGSFFMRRSAWTERVLDVWWDPVSYEQKHMEWAHKEQDAFEQLYKTQPWIRQHTAFLPQRSINSFPPAACGDGSGKNHSQYHYSEGDRDFLVNMAGCEWGRDCWGEMYHYRQYSYWLNRNPWERFKEDLVAVIWFKLTGKWVKL